MKTRIVLPTDHLAGVSPHRPGFREIRLGRQTGVGQFGVNLVRLEAGAKSSSRHWHEAEDEFVYVLEGEPTLIDNFGSHTLKSGDCVGFPAGEANAHHLVNHTDRDAVLLVVGARRPGEETIHYPDDDFGPISK